MKQAILFVFICLTFAFSNSQVTTSTLSGQVTDENNEPLPGATIILKHEPTQRINGRTTDGNGRFIIPNLRPGGPYSIQVSFSGYEEEKVESLYLKLGERREAVFQLNPEGFLVDSVLITDDVPTRSSNHLLVCHILREEIQRLPTLHRSLQDVTRLMPTAGVNSFGGNNFRYNNLSVDGAALNDALGFREPAAGAAGSQASGTPGALAGTQPISLDAIEAVQVSLAPFDVKLGNFTGATINAVTRSGTNKIEGSVYGFGRNQWLTGLSPDNERSRIPAYSDGQAGFRIGAPIIKNKLFVFANYEITNRVEPVLNSAGSPGSNIPLSVAQGIKDSLISKYNYDPGIFGDTTIQQGSHKFFLRFDYHLGQNHQLTLRHNVVYGAADQLDRGANFLSFSSQGFRHKSLTNSTVAELKSLIGENLSNHLTVGYNTVEDSRETPGEVFPHLQIKYNTANTIFLGSYREASIYGLTLKTTQINDNLKWFKGRHTVTLGTNNELYDIQYRFLTAWNGRWEYKSLDNFYNDLPSRIRGVYNLENNDFDFNRNRPSADLRVFLLSVYAQDEFRVNERLNLSGGLRIDMQVAPDKVQQHAGISGTPEFSGYTQDFGSVPQLNPRFYFHYLPDKQKKMQIKGGTGLFSGRIPFAWYAYAHYISGQQYGNIDLRPSSTFPIVRDLSTLQSQQPGLTEINLVDNNFQLPRVWRSSLAWDMTLPGNILLGIEGIYTKTLKDIQFQSINLKDSTAQLSGADDREYFLGSGNDKKINPNYTNVFLLTNTTKGFRYNLTFSLSKQFDKGPAVSVAYTYGVSKDLFAGVRNSMAANFNWNQAINSNNPSLAYSNFDLRHRIILTADQKINWNENHQSSFSLVSPISSGSPYSFTYSGDLNNDGSNNNDLIFVPEEASDIKLVDILDGQGNVLTSPSTQWEQLENYIEENPYLSAQKGKYVQRNGGRTPWNYQVDLRIAHQFFISKKNRQRSLEITLDIINLTNLIYWKWGLQKFVPNTANSSYQLLDFEGLNNGEPEFQFKNPEGDPWQIDPLNSRWQAQLGLRLNF